MSPSNFYIDTPDALIAYWSIFVEEELRDSKWVNAVLSDPTPLVVDVGANAGVFSHYVYCLKPETELIAFEPLPPMVERLSALKQRTGMNLTVVPKAVSSSSGEAWFETTHGYEGTSRLSSSTTHNTQQLRVATTTLDAELKGRDVTLMKIDVEGFESEVIDGGREALARTQFVILESENRTHLEHVMSKLGGYWKTNKVGATDYLFIRSKG
jgi:FkbM family methyltransferase